MGRPGGSSRKPVDPEGGLEENVIMRTKRVPVRTDRTHATEGPLDAGSTRELQERRQGPASSLHGSAEPSTARGVTRARTRAAALGAAASLCLSAAALLSTPPALAGPPLVCHPFEIGGAKSL